MRNRWIRPTIVAAILFTVVVLIVIGCSMKHRAQATQSAKSAGKSAPKTIARKVRTVRRCANAHDSVRPCVIVPSVSADQQGSCTVPSAGISDSEHVIPPDSCMLTLYSAMPTVNRILITVQTEKQPDPAFRLFQPSAQACRPPNVGWRHFRPQAGE